VATDLPSPHPIVRHLARAVIALLCTVPDRVWAIIFTIIVGLGPATGVLAIMVDKIGSAGRFLPRRWSKPTPARNRRFHSGEESQTMLHGFVLLDNQQLPQSAAASNAPLQVMKDWHNIKRVLFKETAISPCGM